MSPTLKPTVLHDLVEATPNSQSRNMKVCESSESLFSSFRGLALASVLQGEDKWRTLGRPRPGIT